MEDFRQALSMKSFIALSAGLLRVKVDPQVSGTRILTKNHKDCLENGPLVIYAFTSINDARGCHNR